MSNSADNIGLKIQKKQCYLRCCVTENVFLDRWFMSFVSFIRVSSGVFNQFTYLIIERFCFH